MKQIGKVTKKWLEVRKQWFKDNPPNHQGYYICYICGKWLLPDEVTLDHVESRSRRPDLRFDKKNLKPCCSVCNNKKGSGDIHKPAFGL